MINMYIIETEDGVLKNNQNKVILFETQFEALNFIEEHNLKNAEVLMADEDDL